MQITTLSKKLGNGEYDEKLKKLYGGKNLEAAKTRYLGALENFKKIYGDRDAGIFSVPGRSEILGNHTDHNNGKVLAAAINLDIIAVAAKNDEQKINIKSEGFDADSIDLRDLAPKENERFTSAAIIRGTAARFKELGCETGGFDAYTTSDVLKGSGLSSSAAFEVCVGFALNRLYNDERLTPVETAKTGQWAENIYFGKPCGLMDQTACASGGFVAIDFKDPGNPAVEKLDFDLTASGYSLCIISTGGSHADLNEEYASITQEMKSTAGYFGCKVLRDIEESKFYKNINILRDKFGDRAILRAIHFFDENARVASGIESLKKGTFAAFLQAVSASGNSSFKYLQNIYAAKNPEEQGLSLAIALAKQALSGKQAAVRVHGGGFAGTILAFAPKDETAEFFKKIEPVFGEGSCLELFVRSEGAVAVI
ncbi:MAG: galactokinase [Oscillospiraceae bacterium]|nr:galactokinase [Oscillospiraceae bacterium]